MYRLVLTHLYTQIRVFMYTGDMHPGALYLYTVAVAAMSRYGVKISEFVLPEPRWVSG